MCSTTLRNEVLLLTSRSLASENRLWLEFPPCFWAGESGIWRRGYARLFGDGEGLPVPVPVLVRMRRGAANGLCTERDAAVDPVIGPATVPATFRAGCVSKNEHLSLARWSAIVLGEEQEQSLGVVGALPIMIVLAWLYRLLSYS